jgi:hydrogenase-4 component F
MNPTIWLLLLLLAPVVTGLLCLAVPNARLSERVNLIGAAVMLLAAALVVIRVARDGAFEAVRGLFYVDQFSALMVGAIAVVGFAAALASLRYLQTELAHGAVPQGEFGLRLYYAGLHAFIVTMLATVTVDSLGLLWVGIEATTVASGLLVGFSRSRAALEAAWKYLLICTVGITCALFGVMLTYYAAKTGSGSGSLDWSALSGHASGLDPNLMRLAFVFVLVGFGTKAGFAPLHTWLADAHSQAPSPVSGLLSGVLLSCALYGILRFHTLTVAATDSRFSNHLLLGFGLLSIAVAVPFIVLARDVKRLLAYSSVEHIGLMAVAFGIGGPLGVTAGLIHLLNHAATKSLLFFLSGSVSQHYKTRKIGAIRGLLQFDPLLGWLLLFGVLAITGAPPFGIFITEIAIVGAGLQAGRIEVAVAIAVIALLGIVFAGFIRHALKIAYGPRNPSGELPARIARPFASLSAVIAVAPLLVVMLLFGLHVPGPVQDLAHQIAGILEPASREVAVR